MDVRCEVDVALRRPPARHATVIVDVTVDLPECPTRNDWFRAEVEAKETACLMAHVSRPNVVMPVAVRIRRVIV